MNENDPRIDYAGDHSAEDVLRWAIGKFHPSIKVACSFQNLVLVHMATQIRPDVTIFAIDTGRLNEESYQCAEDLYRLLGISIEWYFPQHEQVQALEREKGLYSFRRSIANRQECCHIRKVEPLRRALQGAQAWITGVRSDQGDSRAGTSKIEVDHVHDGIIKINPIADWTWDQVQDYVRQYNLPYNRLFDVGYLSIGCAPCTRPVQAGEDSRAGRWWWEQGGHKECGLHNRNWTI
ncbi:MAG TPA: phosphoadenylyl-sulfate reductase [Verrucomicrobia bacterium]|nr:phosphoadenylyl-sulfate reductase [Verrucomicrobiota bacterium]